MNVLSHTGIKVSLPSAHTCVTESIPSDPECAHNRLNCRYCRRPSWLSPPTELNRFSQTTTTTISTTTIHTWKLQNFPQILFLNSVSVMARLDSTSFALVLTTALLISALAVAEEPRNNNSSDDTANADVGDAGGGLTDANADLHPQQQRYYYNNLEDDTDTEGGEAVTDEKQVETTATKGCECRTKSRNHGKSHHKRHRVNHTRAAFSSRDVDELNVVLNAEYLEAEFFLHAAYGFGLDQFNGTALNVTGPAPVGAQKAHTGRFIEHLGKEFGLQSMGHIREILSHLGDKAIARPAIDISRHVWGGLFNEAFGTKLKPAFDPYTTGNHFLLAAYMLPYVSYTGLVALNAHTQGKCARNLVARLVGVKSAEDASIRTVLYQRRRQVVERYNMTVGEFTSVLSALRERLDQDNRIVTDPKKDRNFTLPVTIDEGVLVPGSDTPEKLLTGNIITVNENSLSVGRSPEQILQVLYGTGNASIPGLFFPHGANGKIAAKYLSAQSLLA